MKIECAPRWATPRTPGRRTYGSTAARIAAELGTPLMPWQKEVLDVALEVDPETGRLAYREAILTVPRQSGKTTVLLVLVLLRALKWPRQQIRYTAQTGADARKKLFDDWVPVLEKTRFSRLYKLRLQSGHEAFRFQNGSHFGLVSVTKKTGHGASIDLGILDEAFAHVDARLEQSLKPAMITRAQPQLWVVSTAGTPADSPYLHEKVKLGREAVDNGLRRGVAYFEWSAPDDADPADPATWWGCMPALGRTVTEEAVAADFASMDVSEFRRAFLNVWTTTSVAPVIAPALWAALVDEGSELARPIAFSFDVPPDRRSATIGVGGNRRDGLAHVEVVQSEPGTAWLPRRLSELCQRHRPVAVVCDAAGPAASLVPEIEKLGVTVTTTNYRDLAQATAAFFDAVTGRQLRHLGSPSLAAAIDGAAKRPLGDAWAWSRKNSGVDISPLVAVTLALWGARTAAPSKPKPRVINLNNV